MYRARLLEALGPVCARLGIVRVVLILNRFTRSHNKLFLFGELITIWQPILIIEVNNGFY